MNFDDWLIEIENKRTENNNTSQDYYSRHEKNKTYIKYT